VLKVSFPHLVWEPDPVFTAGRIFPSPLVYVLLGLAQVRLFVSVGSIPFSSALCVDLFCARLVLRIFLLPSA
jgi:uncharacterized membrane protein